VDCVFAHNLTEAEFHPARYKTLSCTDHGCPEDIHCPFKHRGEYALPVKHKAPDALTALARLNLMLPTAPSEALQGHYAWKLSSQITRLQRQLECQTCSKELACAFFVPCGHAVCFGCAEAGNCRVDGNTQRLRLLLD
jgi:hypothetical protein